MLWYVLPLAVAVALSIFPVLAALLVLLSKNPARPSMAYAAGWTLGLCVLVVAFAATARLIPHGLSAQLPPWVHYVEIVVGAFLVVDGVVSVIRSRHRETVAEPPRWLQAASNLDSRQAFGFGVLMNIRPKNLAMTLAAGVAIGAAPISLWAGSVLVLLFTVVGVSTVAGLVLGSRLWPNRVRPVVQGLSGWLVSNAGLVLRLSLAVIGALVIFVGVTALVNG